MPDLVPGSAGGALRPAAAVERYILPALGSIKVTALGRDDVAAQHHEMRKKPYQANRTLGVVSKMFSLADTSSGLALEI